MKKIIIFMTGLLMVLGICTYIVIPKNNDQKTGLREYQALGILNERKDSIDVLFVGDSEVYSSISPMEMYRTTGITSYDLSVSAQKLYTCYELLHQSLINQSPRIVVLETNTIFRNMDQRSIFFSQVGEYIPLVKYHDRWKHLSLQDLKFTISYDDHSVLKGYRIYDTIKSGSNSNYMKYNQNIEAIDSNNIEYVKKIKQLCDQNQCQLILLSVPSLKNWNYARHNAIEQLSNELEIDYLDLNLVELGIDWKVDTRDQGDHVNYTGSHKVSNYLGNYLFDKYQLSDHRYDILYDSWNKDLIEYDVYLSQIAK